MRSEDGESMTPKPKDRVSRQIVWWGWKEARELCHMRDSISIMMRRASREWDCGEGGAIRCKWTSLGWGMLDSD
jgi:hypothetical protein